MAFDLSTYVSHPVFPMISVPADFCTTTPTISMMVDEDSFRWVEQNVIDEDVSAFDEAQRVAAKTGRAGFSAKLKNVYAYLDPRIQGEDIFDAAVYIGKGEGNRCIAHWNGASDKAKPLFKAWIDELKAEGYKASDVVYLFDVGFVSDDADTFKEQIEEASFFSDRDSIAQEAELIEMMKDREGDVPLFNVRSWVPPGSYSDTPAARKRMGRSKRGVAQSDEAVAKAKKARTNDLVLDLYKGEDFTQRFDSGSQSDIVKWIKETTGDTVNDGSLWQTFKPHSRQKSASGYHLVLVSGSIKVDAKTSLLIAMGNATPAVLQHTDGRQYLVWSYANRDCTKTLDYNGGDLGVHLRRSGRHNGTKGWRGRFLCPTEVQHLIAFAPVYHRITVDGTEVLTLSLSGAARDHGFANSSGECPQTVLNMLKSDTIVDAYCNQKRITGRTVHTGRPMAQPMTATMLALLDSPILS